VAAYPQGCATAQVQNILFTPKRNPAPLAGTPVPDRPPGPWQPLIHSVPMDQAGIILQKEIPLSNGGGGGGGWGTPSRGQRHQGAGGAREDSTVTVHPQPRPGVQPPALRPLLSLFSKPLRVHDMRLKSFLVPSVTGVHLCGPLSMAQTTRPPRGWTLTSGWPDTPIVPLPSVPVLPGRLMPFSPVPDLGLDGFVSSWCSAGCRLESNADERSLCSHQPSVLPSCQPSQFLDSQQK
jgi:hypothetical protein